MKITYTYVYTRLFFFILRGSPWILAYLSRKKYKFETIQQAGAFSWNYVTDMRNARDTKMVG